MYQILLCLIIMATLKSGVLVKLLEDIKDDDEQILEDDRKPVLLQIRSIIPVLEEGDLWPNRGFYLKVSDLSHAIYVSLPQEQNEMVLNNKIRLGQFIYVQNLEKAQPLPLLRGLSPVPGRRPCEGSPEDILSPRTFSKLIEISDTDSIVEKGVISEKKIIEIPSDSGNMSLGLSDPCPLIRKNNHGLEQRSRGRFRSMSASKARPREKIIGLQKRRSSFIDEDSDSDSTSSSTSQTSKRKSWTTSDILGVKDIFDSSVIKREIRPVARSRSATASPVCSVRYDSSDDNSSSTTRRRDGSSTKKLVKGSNKIKNPAPKLIPEQASHRVFSIINDTKQAETAISWSSLPLRLVKLGKEVVRQRDIALRSAVDALQEACAAERLLNSLSTYSEFIVAEGDDLEPYVDKFFDLQDDLCHTKLIMQTLTNISPLKTSESDTCGTASVKEALKIALERNKDATSWIKTAVALDLSPCSTVSPNPTATPIAETHPMKKSITSSRSLKPKGASIIKRSRTNDNMSLLLPSDNDNQVSWVRESTLSAATDLVTSLQDECRKLFLGYVEKYLEEVERKTSSVESDIQIAGIMCKVKRVSDWLDVFISKEPNSTGHYEGCSNLDESEMEAYGRVRNKIYGILLKHVERTAMALESINASV